MNKAICGKICTFLYTKAEAVLYTQAWRKLNYIFDKLLREKSNNSAKGAAANRIDGLITSISGNLHLLHRLSCHSRAISLFDSNIYRTRLSASNCRPTRLCCRRKTRHCSRKCIPFVPIRGESRLKKKEGREFCQARLIRYHESSSSSSLSSQHNCVTRRRHKPSPIVDLFCPTSRDTWHAALHRFVRMKN